MLEKLHQRIHTAAWISLPEPLLSCENPLVNVGRFGAFQGQMQRLAAA